MRMRRFCFGSLVLASVLLLTGSLASADDFGREKAPLTVNITGASASTAQTLRSELATRLSDVFDVRFSAEPLTPYFVEVVVKSEPTASYSRKRRTHSAMVGASAYFFENGSKLEEGDNGVAVGGYASGDKAQVQRQSIISTAKNIVAQCKIWFPLLATIRDIDEGVVYIDQGSELGIGSNKFCDVYDEDGDKRGVIEIVRVTEENSEARIVTGGGSIEVGNIVATRREPHKFATTFEVYMMPIESSFGSVFASNYVTDEIDDLKSATAFRLGLGDAAHYKKPVAGSLGLSIFNLDGLTSWGLDITGKGEKFVVFDRVSTYLRGGGGMMVIPSQEYWRPDGGDYNDGLPNEGETDGNFQFVARASVGLRLHFTPKWSFFAEAGYFYAGDGDDWSKYPNEDSKDPVDLDSQWVKYDTVTVRGVCISVGLVLLSL